MKKLKNCLFLSALVLFSLALSQAKEPTASNNNDHQNLSVAQDDLVVRINNDMNEKELKEKIRFLKNKLNNIKIEFSRDDNGYIKKLSASNEHSSCASDDFHYLIITIKSEAVMYCEISDLARN